MSTASVPRNSAAANVSTGRRGMRMSCSHQQKINASTGSCRTNSAVWIAGAMPSTIPSMAARRSILGLGEPLEAERNRRQDENVFDVMMIDVIHAVQHLSERPHGHAQPRERG